ncbi:MAG: hypothetical protein IJB90_02960 [Clostridia bacterium]|nr:hypothetical protein [Clostridia bacterium]
MKKYTVITVIIATIVLGFFAGMYLYRINKTYNTQNETKRTAEEINNDNRIEKQKEISVSNSQEKTSPNCTIILKIYYNLCDHLIETRKNIEHTQVNMTETEVKEKFKEWELQKFTRNRNCIV